MQPAEKPAHFDESRSVNSDDVMQLEELRTNNVPRYLFRAWSSSSGGGPSISINTPQEIVPAAYVSGGGGRFYDRPFEYMKVRASAHYCGNILPLSEYSSWSPSLLLVLCHAMRKFKGLEEDVHVAVMDTHDLDDQVLVWSCEHLGIDIGSNDEYLAHGIIRGRGYMANRMDLLMETGIEEIFPEVAGDYAYDEEYVRETLFSKEMKILAVTADELRIVRDIASLFGHLFLPVATALLSLRPQNWLRKASYLAKSDSFNGQLQGPARGKVSVEELERILEGLGRPQIPMAWSFEHWLTKSGMVNTRELVDVQQWIDLLYAMVKHSVGWKEDEGREDDEEDIEDQNTVDIEGKRAHLSACPGIGTARRLPATGRKRHLHAAAKKSSILRPKRKATADYMGHGGKGWRNERLRKRESVNYKV